MTDNFGFFQGKHTNRVLILGESHYGESATIKTDTVVKNYLSLYANGGYDASYEFFEKIARSFDFDPRKEREFFWNSVYFKNYVCDDVCGIKDNKARSRIEHNRVGYNNALFQFLNEKAIAAVFVFSRLVYNESLPSFFCKGKEDLGCCDDGTLMVGCRKDYISHCIYLAGVEHRYTDILLDHDVAFFGLRHPSAACGFYPENYKKSLYGQFTRITVQR